MADFLPDNDAELVAWTTNFVTYANANLAALGLVAGDLAPITTNQTTFNTTFNANIAAQNAAKNAAAAKDTARANLETVLRTLVRKIQANAAVTNAQRQSLGISLRGTARTPVGAPTSHPVLAVDTSQRLRHTVAFVDSATPTSKAKPDGVLGCEIWVKIGGAPPTDPSELSFLGLDTRTPYTVEYSGDDAGKTAHYMARWTNTRAEQGPWSETASATIGG
jgi:hypothetical protein